MPKHAAIWRENPAFNASVNCPINKHGDCSLVACPRHRPAAYASVSARRSDAY